MSAPAFCSVALLTADLRKLGYPDVDNPKALQPDGAARIDLLAWLAHEIDPTVDIVTVDQLALFWDNLGVHSAYPTATGHRIPFTAPNRPHDRAAAYVFLRAAIDLVLAVRRLRAPCDSPQWVHPPTNESHSRRHSTEAENHAQLDRFDIQCFEQLDALIQQRHSLFPSTSKLFCISPSSTAARRPPLAVRSSSSVNIPRPSVAIETSTSTRFKSRTPKKPPLRKFKPNTAEAACVTCPEREHVLDRLRTLRRELADFVTTAAKPLQDLSDDEALASLDLSVAQTLATSAESVKCLSSRVGSIADDAHAVRTVHARSAKRDLQMETQVATLAPPCAHLALSIRASLTAVARVRSAIGTIRRAASVLESLPTSPVIRSVVHHQYRTECHL